jgi:osmotically-inducible protein OsmY
MKSDEKLRSDVVDELKWDPAVHEAEIAVQADEGIVTLRGQVCNYPEKWRADRAARGVQGVKALVSELTVSLQKTHIREDVDIQRAVRTYLEWHASLAGAAISARVERGWVTLTGSVKWQYQRVEAEDGVRYLTGVTGVTNEIAIAFTLFASAVKTDIEEALRRSATQDAQKIHVDVDGGVVTLTGSVRTWSEAAIAANSAWGGPGVTNVVDKLTVMD